jgi:hypothetical protein
MCVLNAEQASGLSLTIGGESERNLVGGLCQHDE